MNVYAVCTIQETMMTRLFRRFKNGGSAMLMRLFIDGRLYDPVYRERTWMRLWRRLKKSA